MITESQRKAMEKYKKSAKGREAVRRAQRRYEHSSKGKMRAARYAKSMKGIATMRACKRTF